MRNLTFKAAMLKGSQPTVNRQSTDGQSQRHCKQTPLSKRWKVLMTLVFLFTFAIGQMWADTNTIYSFNNDSVKSNLWFSVTASPVVNSITGSGSGSGAKAAKNSSGTQITVQSKATANSVYTMTFGLKSGITVTGVALELGDNKLNTVDIKMGSSTFTGSSKNWSLSDLSLTSSFSITFNGNETSGSSNRNTKIKNITFTYTTSGDETGGDPEGCTAAPAAPTKFEAGSITEDGVTFSITDAANAGKYDIYYSTSNTAPEATTAASATSTANSKAITGLTASTKYYAWVRSVCDDSHKSAWVALTGSFFTTAAPDPCTTHHWFVATADATANGKTNWDGFTNAPTGSNGQSNSVTIDGSNYTLTKRTGSIGEGGTILGFTIPANKAGTLYGYMKSSGTGARTLSLKKGDDVVKTNTEITDGNWTLITISAIAPGTYTLSPDKNVQIQMFALKVCDAEFNTITLEYADGVTPDGSIDVIDGTAATKPANPTRGKYTFLGWFVGDTDTEYVWSTAVTDDITLKAHWQDPWTITFNSDGGSEVASITVKHNTAAEKPADPTKDNYEFNGWYIGDTDNAFDWNANVTANYSLKAHWLPIVAKYDIEYYDGETKIGTEAQVRADQHPTAAGIETSKSLYHFDGWFLSSALTGDPVNLNTVTPSEGLKIYGKWTKTYGNSLDFAAVTTAGTTGSNPIATFLASGNMAATGLTESLWETSTGKSGFIGYKLKDAGAQIKFNLQAGKRAIITLGNVAAAVNINAGGAESVVAAAAGDDAETVVPAILASTEDILVTLTTTTKGTVTLKSILIEDIPALDNDATLKDLKVGGVPVAGFSAGTVTYYYEVPYGTEDFPVISATANSTKALQVAIQQAVWTGEPYNCYRAQANVQAQDGSWGYYDVRFYFAPKYGVELIKATHDGTASGANKAGYWASDVTIDKFTQNGGKLGSEDHYFGFTLGNDKKFQAGDLVVVKASTISSTVELFDKKTFTTDQADSLTYLNKGNFDTHSKMYTFTLTADADKLYLYRTKTAKSQMNPVVEYIAVYRQMAPFIEEFKIGDAVGTIDGTNIAVEVPYAADLEHLTPAIKYWANGTAQISPAIGVTDFTDPVVFTVSSGYAEDATGAYAPVPYTVTVTKEAHYEAKIGETGYATLVAAVAAAQDGDEIVLQENVTNGAGVMLTKTDAKEITIDFGGYTYTAVSPAVGSAGTQNQAFHLEKGNTVTLKNGTITSSGSEIKMLIQNYCDLTLEDITLDGTGLEGSHRYVMSNNCGDVVIGDGTTITAKTGDVAFDVCATNYYPEGVTVTVKDGATISGIVEYDVWGTKPADNHAELAIEGGNFDVTWNVEAALAEDAKDNLNVSGGTFTAAVPADYCAEGYAPTSWTVGTETKYGVHLAGVIRGAASTNSDGVYYYTLDNDVTIFSSESDGRLKTSNHIATSSDVVTCGGDVGGHNVNKSAFVLQFPVNVKEFTIYGANNTERTISKVYVNATASTEIKIKNVGRELTGTYTNTKDEKCQTLTAVFAGENIISANDYVLINLSGSVNMYRILYTEAECTDPVITAVNNTIGTVGESATVSVEATALGATYQWYTCDENGDNAEIIGTATAASYTFTKGAGVEYFKVVVGNNCNTATVSAVAKAEVWAPTTTLVDVTENTTWDWTLVTSRADGSAIDDSDGNGPKLNTTNGMIIGNYILGNNFDKVEGNNGAYAIRKAANKYYQGASLHMHTTVSGYLSIWAANEGHSMTLNLVNDGRDMQIAQLTGSQVEYKVYVKAGDVVIYNIPASSTYPMRVSKMIFTVDETPDYTRNVSNNIGTLCVDHNVVAGGALGATFYQIASRNELYDYKIDFEEVLPGEELKAGQPYIFKSNTGKIELFYGATVADAPVAVRGMIGSFVDTQVDIDEDNKSNILYIASNKLWNCEDLVGIGLEVVANRAYIVMSEVPTYADYQAAQTSNPAPRRRVTLGKDEAQVVTGFGELETSETPVKVLINGQIFIIRGEKMFDVTGKLVK